MYYSIFFRLILDRNKILVLGMVEYELRSLFKCICVSYIIIEVYYWFKSVFWVIRWWYLKVIEVEYFLYVNEFLYFIVRDEKWFVK